MNEDELRDLLARAWDEGYGDDLDANMPRENPYRIAKEMR